MEPLTFSWTGAQFPVRLLTPKEIEIFTPRCCRCGLKACVVELQGVKRVSDAIVELHEIEEEIKKYYCSFHSSHDVPDYHCISTIKEYEEALKEGIVCPKNGHIKYPLTCVKYQPSCIKRCDDVKRALRGFDAKKAKKILLMVKENEAEDI